MMSILFYNFYKVKESRGNVKMKVKGHKVKLMVILVMKFYLHISNTYKRGVKTLK